jgi:hypothetical protein
MLFKQFQNGAYRIGPVGHHIVIHGKFGPFAFLETELRQLGLEVLFFFIVFFFWNVTLAETHLLFVELFVNLVEVVYIGLAHFASAFDVVTAFKVIFLVVQDL